MYRILTIIALLIFFCQPMLAQRTYSNEFMSIGVGAPALGMGNATVASSNDVTSGYWNPAGLTRVKNKYGLSLMHSEQFAGISSFDYVGASYRVDENRVVGLTLLRNGVDDIQNTLDVFDSEGNIDYDRIKLFSVADYGVLLSYAQVAKNPNLSYGANLKIIHRIIGEFATAWGFGFDVGLQYRSDKWQFGAVLRDATSTFNAWSFDNDELEITVQDSTYNTIESNAIESTLPKAQLGVARKFNFNEKLSLLAEIDADLTFDGEKHQLISNDFISIDPHVGMELSYKGNLFFRTGLNYIQEVPELGNETSWLMQPNIGLGLRIKNLAIDYALTDVGNQGTLDYSNVFSLRYFWN